MKFKQLLNNSVPLLVIALLVGGWWHREVSRRRDYENPSARTAPAPVTGRPPQSETWQLEQGSVYDGDTLQVRQGFTKMKVRFCGIDAPEKNQPLGIEARDYLRSLLAKGDGNIIVVPIEKDRYGRTVADLFIMPRPGTGYQPEEEIHLNSAMVVAGMAYHYAQYSANCPNQDSLIKAEETAKAKRVGVWAQAGAIPPWEWRKENSRQK